jgi:hypothetical protein
MRELINLLLIDDNTDFLQTIHLMFMERDLSVKSVETIPKFYRTLMLMLLSVILNYSIQMASNFSDKFANLAYIHPLF